jgi:hypothetical protein
MPRAFTICRHEKREEIDEALVSAEPYRGISRRFAVSEDAVQRHKKAHLSAKVVKAVARREERRGDSLIEKVDALTVRTHALLDEVFPETRESGQKVKPRDVAAVVREVREMLRLTAQLTGQLKGDGATVNVGIGILSTPAWGRVASVVTEALRDEPRAREKVALALARMANGTEVTAAADGVSDST